MNLRILQFYILLASSLSLFGQVDELNLNRIPLSVYYSAGDYNGGIQNWHLTQDQNGFIYAANNYGLLEFDGETWNRYGVAGSTKLRTLLIDSANTIYVGGQGQFGTFILEDGGLIYKSLVDRIPKDIDLDEVWNLADVNEGILINTTNHLLLLENDSISKIEIPGDIGFMQSTEGSTYVATKTEGIFKYVNRDLVKLQGSEIFTGNLQGAIQLNNGTIVFLSSEGKVFKFSSKFELFKTPVDSFLRDALVNTCLKLRNGTLVIGTQNDGFLIVDDNFNAIKHLTKRKGLSHRTVLSLHEDRFENLWVGLNNGISRIELGSPLSLINEELNLEGTGYVARLEKGVLYLGTSNGLFYQETKTSSNLDNPGDYKLIQGTRGQVNDLSNVNGEIILSHHTGAFSVDGTRINPFFDETGAWKFELAPDGKMMVGGTYNGIYIFERTGNNWIKRNKIEKLDESSRLFEFENDSTIWMTHGYKGAFKISLNTDLDKTKSVRRFGEGDGFGSNLLISVYQIENELLFTGQQGIKSFDEETSTFVPHPFLTEWLGNVHVSKIAPSINGDLFFIGNNQLGHFKRKSIGVFTKEMDLLRRVNKYLSDDLENISVIDERNILIGAKEGFIHYNPLFKHTIKEDVPVFIRNVSLDFANDSIANITGSRFSGFSSNTLDALMFHFSSPYFDSSEDIKYAYRLRPFEENWSDWLDISSKEFTSLPPNDYTFEVKARSVYGHESIPATVSFTINPKWYRSNLAYATYVTLFLLGFSLITFLREKKHKDEKTMLHLSKEEAIKSKDLEIDEVAQRSNEEIQNLRNENLKKEITLKNNELAAVTMNLLSKNEFVQSMRKKISEVIHAKSDINTELQKVLKSIDNNLNENDSWEQFAYHFDQVHGNFLQKIKQEVKLTSQETKLCAYLRLNMSTKDIASLMNITVRGVELARYRLRKKLNIDRNTNLVDYLLEF